MSNSPNIIFAGNRAYVEHPKYGWDESKCRRPTYEELETALHDSTSHARTIEALRVAAEPFAKAWVLIASQQQLAERLSLAQIAELACHELSGADFQRVARALKEHTNG